MTIKYNGHTFSDKASITYRMSSIYDDADVAVIYHRVIVTIVDFVIPEVADCASTSTPMEDVKAALMRPGMPFHLSLRGFGDAIIINDDSESNTVWDTKAGPKPRGCDIEPIGNNLCSQVTWTCEIHLPPCAAYQPFEGVAAFNYTVSYAISLTGFTTRTVNGYLQIAQNRIDVTVSPYDAGKLRANADYYRDNITEHFNRMLNAHRTQSYTMNADQSRLSFNIVDKEIESPNAFPKGVVTIKCPTTSRIRWPMSGTTTGSTTISCEMELDAHTPRVRAWEIFDELVRLRLAGFAANNKTVIVRDLTVSEDWYSHNYSFNLHVTTHESLFNQFAYFSYFQGKDVITSNWTTWYEDLNGSGGGNIGEEEKAYHSRGLAGMKTSADDSGDQVWNPCRTEWDAVEDAYDSTVPNDKTLYGLCNTPPAPENSWTDDDMELIEAPNVHTTVQTTYGAANVEMSEFDSADEDAGNGTMLKPNSGDYETCISEAPPVQRWIWRGTVKRVGYPIPAPNVITIGGKPATIAGQPLFTTRLVGYAFCIPIYEASWSIGLVLSEPPEDVEPGGTDLGTSIPDDAPGGSSEGLG